MLQRGDESMFDMRRRYVRLVRERDTGLVEFEFAIGEPQVFVEMAMERPAFDAFCRDQGVTPTQGALAEAERDTAERQWEWTLRQARGAPRCARD